MSKYRDFTINFEPHPATGDITALIDERAVQRAMVNLVRTSGYDRLFSGQEKGAGSDDLLFKTYTPLVKEQIEARIRKVIDNYEPRVDLRSVNATPVDHGKYVKIMIVYKTRLSTDSTKFEFYLKRVL